MRFVGEKVLMANLSVGFNVGLAVGLNVSNAYPVLDT
jgi:hypothetical protein